MLGLEDPVDSERNNLDWIAFVFLIIYIFVHVILEILVVQEHLVGALDAGDVLAHEVFTVNLQNLLFFHHIALDEILFNEIGKHLTFYKLGEDVSKELG